MVKCRYCEKEIKLATPMVIGQTKNGNRTYRMYFHPQCWIDNGLAYLSKNPYTPGVRGRKQLSLTPEDARKRYLLIRRYNTFKNRKSKLKKFPDDMLRIIRLETGMDKIIEEIKNAGGVPTKWITEREALLHI